jgi:hypothetical protein
MREVEMARLSFTKELSPSQIEIRELEPFRIPVGRTFLISLAVADIAAVTLTLLGN